MYYVTVSWSQIGSKGFVATVAGPFSQRVAAAREQRRILHSVADNSFTFWVSDKECKLDLRQVEFKDWLIIAAKADSHVKYKETPIGRYALIFDRHYNEDGQLVPHAILDKDADQIVRRYSDYQNACEVFEACFAGENLSY